jgi:hypothetical protein
MRYTAPRDDTMLSARIPRALMDRLHQYATQHRCSLTALVRESLERRLEQEHVPGWGTPTPPAPAPPELLALVRDLHRWLQPVLPAADAEEPAPAHLGIQKAYTPTTAPTESVIQEAYAPVLTPDAPLYDEAKYHLGPLCKARHAYGTTGQTLRRRGSNACLECELARRRQRRARRRPQAAPPG